MNIIETVAPIAIEKLKEYFNDKQKIFLVDYDNSNLKNEKFLIYLSNLDLPCDLIFDKNKEDHQNLLMNYLKTKNIISIPSLEKEFLNIFLEIKGISNFGYKDFIEKNKEELNKILKLLESMSLYNFYCVNSETFKKDIESKEHKSCDDLGYNFVNLFKYEDFNLLFENMKSNELFFYEDFFKEYMFKGKNLYYYWANNNNPLFLMTWGIANGLAEKYFKQGTELNVTPV